MKTADPPRPAGRSFVPATRTQFLSTAAVGLVFVVGVLLGVSFLNGPWYWKWGWRDLGLSRVLLLHAIPFGLLAGAIWRIRRFREEDSPLPLLGLLFAVAVALQVSGAWSEPGGPGRIRAIVESPGTTSYFTDAVRVSRQPGWLSRFHEDSELKLHSSTHPPGPILYYLLFIRLFGGSAAVIGGLALGALSCFALPALYHCGGLWGLSARHRLTACAFYCLLPATSLFLPEFDTVYPVFTLLLIGCWARALGGSATSAVAFGGVLFLSTLFAYNLLTLGTFLAGYFVFSAATIAPEGRPRLLFGAEVAALSFLGFHVLFAVATGYDALASFRHATSTQRELAATYDRYYWPSVLFDLYDFALGAGFLVAPLVLYYGESFLEEFEWSRADLVVGALGLSTILVTDMSGLLRTETARVWIFLQPLWVLPAATRIVRWSVRDQGIVLALQGLILVVLRTRMGFLNP
jgi:hypothetical protein